MAAKSIIDIEVNDSAFKEFQALFNKYNQHLKKTPATWAAVGKSVSSTSEHAQSMESSFQQIAESNRKIAEMMKKFQTASADSDTKWKSIAKSTKEVGKTVSGLVTGLLKIAGVGGIFGGLLGAGGLFGLSRLANSAAGQQRNARGMNVTPGEQQAFGVNYKQFINPDSYLSNVNSALQDYTKRWAFYSAGLSESQIQGKDAAEVGKMLLPLLRQRFIQGGKTQQGADAFGLTQFADMQDLNRLSNSSPQEISAAQARYEADKKSLELSRETTTAWTDLNRQLDLAGKKIEDTFITSLSPLAPQLAKLSDGFSEAISIFAKSPAIKEWVDDLAIGMKQFATYISSPDFKKDVSDFVSTIQVLARKTASAARFLGLIPDRSKPAVTADTYREQAANGTPVGAVNPAFPKGFMPTNEDILSGLMDKARRKTSVGATYFAGIESKYGIPQGLLRRIEKQESGFNVSAVSPKGAMGPFQFMPATAKEYGLKDPFNLDASADAAARKMRNLLSDFKGDIAKAVASYNWGEGNVHKTVSKYGDAWQQHLPKETSDYVNKIAPGLRVEITNATGGSAIVSTNQLAH